MFQLAHTLALNAEEPSLVVDVARATGINRNMVAMLYYDRAQRVDLADIAKLCEFMGCGLTDLFELIREGGEHRD